MFPGRDVCELCLEDNRHTTSMSPIPMFGLSGGAFLGEIGRCIGYAMGEITRERRQPRKMADVRRTGVIGESWPNGPICM